MALSRASLQASVLGRAHSDTMQHGRSHQEESNMTTRTFVDTLGRVVQISHAPQRLVSLVPSITEVLFSFGWGQRVLGITDYCTEPVTGVAGKTTIGGTKN